MVSPKTCTECDKLTRAIPIAVKKSASEFYCDDCRKSYSMDDEPGAVDYWLEVMRK